MVRFVRMKRQKYQRPEVFATGKREKLWKVRYREYFVGRDGKEAFRFKAATWSRGSHTKAQAQTAADKLILDLQAGPVKADGSMTLHAFWEQIYLPIRSRTWTGYTPTSAGSLYRNHIQPQLGNVPLQDITKAMIQIHLGKLADEKLGWSMVDGARVRLHSIMEEAADNDFIIKNPCRKIETPKCKPPVETRSLTEAEVQALWDGTAGRDYLFWRILIMTGSRPGEVLALESIDLRPDCLLIDEAMVSGTVKLPKRNKIREAPIPESLRAELEEWMAGKPHRLMFPSTTGKVCRLSADEIQAIVTRGRVIIPCLTFRQCRTTFATLFEGDEADRSSILGHNSPAFTLKRYRKPIMERRQQSVEAMDRRLKVVPIKKRQA